MNQMNGMAFSSFGARASRWRSWVVTTACVAALSACGGGGSSSPAPVEHSRVIVSTLAVHDANGQPMDFKKLAGITLDPSTGNLYVVDAASHQIFMVTPYGLVTLVAGSTTSGFTDGDGTHAQFWYPEGITIDATGALYLPTTTTMPYASSSTTTGTKAIPQIGW